MFGLSFIELAIIVVLALVLLGADQLPQAARTVGKGLRELRRATEDLKDQIETEIYADEQKHRPPPIAPVPSAPRPAPLPGPESVPAYLPGMEPPAGAAAAEGSTAPADPAPAEGAPEGSEPPRS